MTEKHEYEVIFYKREDGHSPTDDFLDNLSSKERAKVEKWIEQLEIYGPNLPRPFADTIRGKIRELRIRFGNQHYRLLYFFFGKMIVVTHGFVKRARAIPEEELIRGIRFMNDFIQRTAEDGGA